MKFNELKSMSKEEIESKLKELKMELIKSNAQVATGTVPKNPGQLKQTKKAIAKIRQLLSSGDEAKKLESKIPNSRNEVSRKPAPKKENKEPKTEGKKE